ECRAGAGHQEVSCNESRRRGVRVPAVGDGEDCRGGGHAGPCRESRTRPELAGAAGGDDRVREGELALAAVEAKAGESEDDLKSKNTSGPPKNMEPPPVNTSATT